MNLYYDLHLHSTLSPCGDKDMTPNNIVNMAYIKGLDIISITDHNNYRNVRPSMKLAKERDMLLLPGIEITTAEEIHVLCYFDDVEILEEFGEIIFDSLPNIKNNKEVFGEQLVLDDKDEVVTEVDKLLLNSSKYNIKKIYNMTKYYNGVMIPAHVDRKSYSILSVLGFIPEELQFQFVEIRDKNYKNKSLKSYNVIYNSDAHRLSDINEPINKINIKKRELKRILKYLKIGDIS